jgi:phage FluMu protein Com
VVNQYNRKLVCPWCNKGEVLADGKAKVTLSIMCPKCSRFFTGDLDTLKTERAVAQKRLGRMK